MNEIENLAMLTIREKENKDGIYGIYLLVNAISSFLITGIIFYFFLRNIEFSAQLILSVGFFFMIYFYDLYSFNFNNDFFIAFNFFFIF